MYDRRLGEWGVSKNLKKTQKDKMVAMLVQSGSWAPSRLSSPARHVDMTDKNYTKVLRYLKDRARISPSSKPRNVRSSSKSFPTFPRKPIALSAPTECDFDSWVDVAAMDTANCFSIKQMDELCARSKVAPMQGTHSVFSIDISGETSDLVQAPISSNPRVGIRTAHTSLSDEDFQDSTFTVAGDTGRPSYGPIDNPRTLSVDGMLRTIQTYIRGASRHTNAGSTGQCGGHEPSMWATSDQGSPSADFWTEMKHGIYLLKTQKTQAGWRALDMACDMAPKILVSPQAFDFLFMRELFLTLSPVNTRVFPKIRTVILQYLGCLASFKLSKTHPIFVICHQLQQDGHDRHVSEVGLQCMLDTFATREQGEAFAIESKELAFQVERALITLLRRDGQLEAAAGRAEALMQISLKDIAAACWGSDTMVMDRASTLEHSRLAARELAHVRMDQGISRYDKAIEISVFVLTGTLQLAANEDGWPPLPYTITNVIRDKSSVYTMEDLAQIYEKLGMIKEANDWLQLAVALALDLFGDTYESTVTRMIGEKLRVVQTLLECQPSTI